MHILRKLMIYGPAFVLFVFCLVSYASCTNGTCGLEFVFFPYVAVPMIIGEYVAYFAANNTARLKRDKLKYNLDPGAKRAVEIKLTLQLIITVVFVITVFIFFTADTAPLVIIMASVIIPILLQFLLAAQGAPR